MKIDFQTFEEGLKPFKVDKFEGKEIGIAKVIQYVWNHTSTKNVDFNSFTLNDAKRAFWDFYLLPTHEDEPSAFEIAETEENIWAINNLVDTYIYHLVQNKNKIYENEDDFI